MKEWTIPVTWSVCGKVKVKADTLEEAMDTARTDDSIPLPEDSDYIDGSWEVSDDDVEAVRCIYNNNQKDEGEQ